MGFALPVTLIGTLFVYTEVRLQGDDREKTPKAQKAQREERLRQMRSRAEATQVLQLHNGKQTTVKVIPQPVFRYSDQPRLILDATLWVWGHKGRPIALQKVEFYRRPEGHPKFSVAPRLRHRFIGYLFHG